MSEWNFGVFKSPKKPTKFQTDFCPMKLGHKFVKNLVGFWGDLKTPKFHSEINCPLRKNIFILDIYEWTRKLQKSPPQHRDTLFPVAAVRQGWAARWRRAPKTHSLLITLFTSFSGAINWEKRSRDFINQEKKCITEQSYISQVL